MLEPRVQSTKLWALGSFTEGPEAKARILPTTNHHPLTTPPLSAMRCLLALGSNLGDRRAILAQACAAVAELSGCQLLARSCWHATEPIGGAAGQGKFLNGTLLLETSLGPQQLATALQQVETSLGRQRTERWDARTIDIDLLLYGQKVIDTVELTVPHPRMTFRRFVLEPAAEIAGPMLHPTSGWTIARLLAHLRNSPRFVVVTAAEKPIADWLVSQIRQIMDCPVIPDFGKKIREPSISQPNRGIEFSESRRGKPPVLATLPPGEFGAWAAALVTQKYCPRPALVIAVDVAQPHKLRTVAKSAGFVVDRKKTLNESAHWLDFPGLGPLARITVDDPNVVLQEAQAALRCIWPDIE